MNSIRFRILRFPRGLGPRIFIRRSTKWFDSARRRQRKYKNFHRARESSETSLHSISRNSKRVVQYVGKFVIFFQAAKSVRKIFRAPLAWNWMLTVFQAIGWNEKLFTQTCFILYVGRMHVCLYLKVYGNLFPFSSKTRVKCWMPSRLTYSIPFISLSRIGGFLWIAWLIWTFAMNTNYSEKVSLELVPFNIAISHCNQLPIVTALRVSASIPSYLHNV